MKKLLIIIAILFLFLAFQKEEVGDRAWFDGVGYCTYNGEEWVVE